MAEARGFTFPGTFEVSAMGASDAGLERLVPDAIEALGLVAHRDSISTRASREGNYVSVTIRFDAASREDYQAVYGALRALPQVRWTL